MISDNEVLALKRKAEDGKQKLTQAETLMGEVQRNIEKYSDDLRALGVDPEHADEYLKTSEATISAQYEAIRAKLPV